VNNKKLLIRNYSLYTIGSVLTQAFSVMLVPIYSKYLSTADYGILSSMGILGQVTAIVISLNIAKSLYRCYWDYRSEQEQKVFFGTIFISVFVLSTINIGGLFIFNKYLGLVYKSIPFYPYYFLVLLTIYIKPYYDIIAIYFRIKEESKKYLFFSLSYFFVNILLIIYFVVIRNAGAVGSLLATLITNILFLFISLIILRKIFVFKFDYAILRNVLAYSLPLIPGAIATWVVNLSDRVFIERFYTLSEVGIYSMGYKLASVIGLLTTGFFTAYHPMFLRIANSSNKEVGLLYNINKLFMIIALVFTTFIYIFAPNITEVILDPKFYESYKIFRIIIISNLIAIIGSFTNLSLAQDKKMKSIMLIGVSGAFLNIPLNFLLVPMFGMFGAAYATIITFIYISAITYYVSKKYTTFFILWDWKTIITYLTIAFLTILICEAFSELLIKLIICVVLMITFFYFNRTLIIHNIKSLLKTT